MPSMKSNQNSEDCPHLCDILISIPSYALRKPIFEGKESNPMSIFWDSKQLADKLCYIVLYCCLRVSAL